jgi:hypothetical protein
MRLNIAKEEQEEEVEIQVQNYYKLSNKRCRVKENSFSTMP